MNNVPDIAGRKAIFTRFISFVSILVVFSASVAVVFSSQGTMHPLKAQAASTIVALPIISTNVPAYTNDDCGGSYAASRANDKDYGTQWEGCRTPSTANPTWLAYDMSHSLHGAAPGKVVVAWYNDPDSGSITNFDNPPSAYNNIGSYTIDVNAASGGITLPTTNWVTLVTVTGNTWSSRQHLIDMTGYNWLRINVTVPNGSSGNMGVAINMDVHDASQVTGGSLPQDDWIFLGDSITASGMNHDPRGIGAFSQLISAQTSGAYYPVQQDLGLGGTDTTYGAANINGWLPNFPGKYVALDYGTNDANGCGISNTTFYNNYITMIQAVLAAGKVPIIPYIPWAPSTSVQQCAGDPQADPNVSPHLNAMITKLYSDPTYGSQIIPGPNLWATFYNQPNLFQDSLHPNETTGYDAYRNAWVSAMLTNVYNVSPGTPTPTLTPTLTATPTFTPSPTPTATSTPTPTPTATSTPTPTPTATSTPTPTPTTTATPTGGGVTLIGTNSVNGNFGGGIKIKIPTVQSGDLLIAVTGTNGSPSSWTTPSGWNSGTGSGHPDGQGLNWWWKVTNGTESGTSVTLKSSSWADGGGVVIDYRGTSTHPILAVSSLVTNDNGGAGKVTSAKFNGVSLSGTVTVMSLLLMSWQPTTATIGWPGGYTLQATANDGYGFVAAGANLTSQSVSSLNSQTVTLSASQYVVPTLQIAVLVGP